MPLAPDISVVIPVFNERENVEKLYRELTALMQAYGKSYEIIFINDGSTDGSLDVLKTMASSDNLLKIIALSRNFGQTAALESGIHAASGKTVILMDGDLQNDPADIPLMVRKLDEGFDVVSGWRRRRKDNLMLRRIPSVLANKLISLITGVRLHDYGCTLKAYRSEIIGNIRLYGEMHRFIPVYAHWMGARITEMEVNHRPRVKGRSKYNLWRTPKVILDLITVKFISGYETKPIYVFGGSGLLLILASFLLVFVLLYNKFVKGVSMIQSPILLLSAICVIVGVQSILIGLLAEMQIRSYFESSRRKTYHVKERINFSQ